MELIDLRSDTVTRPSVKMRKAMMFAPVGDDVFGEDPTMNALQERMAGMFGKEAALFVPSGTMGNEICINVSTHPGDEIIVEQDSHIFVYETAAPSLLSGVQMTTITGIQGALPLSEIMKAVRPDAYYLPRTRLICFENTHGRSAGSVVPLKNIKEVSRFASSKNIMMHLDGARIWNASVATGIPLKEYARYFDTVSVCFSKGLGAPVGSCVIGKKAFIEEARRFRKILGGGMRQVGILAAAAIYAIENNIERLKEDHEKARFFAESLAELNKLEIDLNQVQTNMVIMEISGTGKSQNEVLGLLGSRGVLLTPERHSSIRAVMHMDVSAAQVKKAVKVFRSLFR